VQNVTVEQCIRVVVGEDEPLVREGVVHVLREAGMEVVGVAADADDLLRKVGAHRPDVVVTDIRMPPGQGEDGLRAACTIRSQRLAPGVLVLSQFLEDRYPRDLVFDGADGIGYLLKQRVGDVPAFVDAVQRVAHGGSALDPDVIARMVGRPRVNDPIDSLTRREGEVLALMAQGRSNHGIADAIVVTVAAVERHVTSIFSKLGLDPEPEDHRRVLAVLEYLRR
jgi:DNA-binding NarL/FixJ family response regulator